MEGTMGGLEILRAVPWLHCFTTCPLGPSLADEGLEIADFRSPKKKTGVPGKTKEFIVSILPTITTFILYSNLGCDDAFPLADSKPNIHSRLL